MSTSDAIVVGEAWISEHYLTTDAKSQSFLARVIERRKQWDEAAATGTVRTRFTEARVELESTLAALVEHPDGEDLPALYKSLRDLLGFTRDGLVTSQEGPLTRVSTPGLAGGAPLVLVEARPVETPDELLAKDADTLLASYPVDDTTEITSAARLLSTLFVADDGPSFALVLAGRWALVAEQARWAEGRYLAVDLQLVCERNDAKRGGEIDRALTCLSAESLAPNADGDLWWNGVLEESVRHTVGVSQDLREGIRLSIEIIANEVVRRRRDQDLPPLQAEEAQPLAKQSLRFLYRILFLLYAEASPELGVLPIGAPEYQQGYSLDRLRDLTLVELTTQRSQSGTHLYESLAVLFRLVDQPPRQARNAGDFGNDGLDFHQLRADLFKPEAVAHIAEAGLGNAALQQVLRHLLLSKESRGKDRGFISYAELGINQLGAVYEGLMSYTGFFAEDDLYEVAKGGDASKGSWVVPVSRAEGIAADDFVRVLDPVTGERKPVLHERGTFVFRLSGRDRQQSASYYTPEVLTRFTVGQALDELLGEQTEKMTAREILDLTICEPALGSGAFAIEAVRQLAERYLSKRQDELGVRIDPDDYPKQLQRVKAYLALHQVYGVDLNATAVELAEISLWLDTMGESMDAPWFGLHLRRGNSLIGARRAMFRASQIEKKTWLKDVPEDFALADVDADLLARDPASALGGRVHHFLLPAEGWGSAVEVREGKELAPEALERLKTWRKSVQVKPTKAQQKQLADLAIRVEQLWQLALARLRVAEQEIRRSIDVWGADDLPVGGAVQREQIEAALSDPSGAYGRLKLVMDAWCALWFWPLTDTPTTMEVDGERRRIHPPSLDQWIDALTKLLGRHEGKRHSAGGQDRLTMGGTWDELGVAESLDLGFASSANVASTLDNHSWLIICQRLAQQQGFFHWDLEFARVFATRGGFDVQLGNPPWVRPDIDERSVLAESDPWWALGTGSEEFVQARRRQILSEVTVREGLLTDLTNVVAVRSAVSSVTMYPQLAGLRPDLYRCFMTQTWRHQNVAGVTGLIHFETHFTDESAGHLRLETYRRLRRHWQFINELRLFEIQNQKRFGVNIYGAIGSAVDFLHAASLYHPDTVMRSLVHDGTGEEPGVKDPDGNWDLRPHSARVSRVDLRILKSWAALLEEGSAGAPSTRMVYSVNRSTTEALARLASSARLGGIGYGFSDGWNETVDRKAGLFEKVWGPVASWDQAIIQGSHIHVSNPFYKSPNSSMANHRDWRVNDLEDLDDDALPVTTYKPSGPPLQFEQRFTHWVVGEDRIASRSYFRLAWRAMAANTGERTLIPALIPRHVTHLYTLYSIGGPGLEGGDLLRAQAVAGSLLADLVVRAVPKSAILKSSIDRLPRLPDSSVLTPEILLRIGRLNCLTSAYRDLWSQSWQKEFVFDEWASDRKSSGLRPIAEVSERWDPSTPLRRAEERRQALVEIDALVAMILGVTADQLCTIYRTQFPVLYGYDRNRDHYDASGRLVPQDVLVVWRRKGDRISEEERTATNATGNTYTYGLPFQTLDREHDMRIAYAEFERRLKERS